MPRATRFGSSSVSPRGWQFGQFQAGSSKHSPRDSTCEMSWESLHGTSFLCWLSPNVVSSRKPQLPSSPGKEQAVPRDSWVFPGPRESGKQAHPSTVRHSSDGSWRGGRLREICKGKRGVSDVRAQREVIVSTAVHWPGMLDTSCTCKIQGYEGLQELIPS